MYTVDVPGGPVDHVAVVELPVEEVDRHLGTVTLQGGFTDGTTSPPGLTPGRSIPAEEAMGSSFYYPPFLLLLGRAFLREAFHAKKQFSCKHCP